MSIPQEPKNTSSSVKRRADAGLHKQHQQPVDVFVVLNGMLKSRWLSALAGIVDSLTAPHVYSHLARQVKTTTMLQVEFLTLSGAPTPGLARGEDRTFCTQWESLHLHQLPIPTCTFFACLLIHLAFPHYCIVLGFIGGRILQRYLVCITVSSFMCLLVSVFFESYPCKQSHNNNKKNQQRRKTSSLKFMFFPLLPVGACDVEL